jgi:hypothetical protein
VGVELFDAERQTERQTEDMTKLIVAFRNFAKAANKQWIFFLRNINWLVFVTEMEVITARYNMGL